MNIQKSILEHFLPGKQLQLTTVEFIAILKQHVTVYENQTSEIAETLAELGFETFYSKQKNALVWGLTPKVPTL